ncbi:MAG: undecaprenyl-diphosphate phosphatase [Acidiferrobacteraceae bacterium]
MDTMQMMLLAALQGVTELFPISSLGHSVLVPALLGWHINRDAPSFLPFLVVLHVGTASALLAYFWRDWWQILRGFARARGGMSNPEARLLWLLAVASVPAGLIGLVLEKRLRLLFGGFVVVVIWLALNGVGLLVGDLLRRRKARHEPANMGFGKALIIGFAQALALIPGMSRSGATLVAGLGTGLDYEASARFSFLMATPIIAAAALLEVPKLFRRGLDVPLGPIFASGLLAAVFAYLSTWFLMRYFRGHEQKALRPFGFYCLGLAAFALVWHFRH